MAVSSSSPLPKTLKIGIVGFGVFGQFLCKTMIKQGHILTATSRSDYSQLCAALGISFFRYNEQFSRVFLISTPKFLVGFRKRRTSDSDCDFLALYFQKIHRRMDCFWLFFWFFFIVYVIGVRWIDRVMDEFFEAENDVIVICTSIVSLTEVLKSLPLHRLKRPTLFVDVLSVKEYPREVLLKVLPEESDVLCTHPMFGPMSGKDGWNGLSFMYERVRIRDEATCYSFLHIFESEGCRMLEMTCEEHDKLAARSQFLTHTIGRILSEMEVKSTPIDTKGFQTLIQLKDSTIRDSFDLFSGLFIHNKYAKEELKNLGLAVEKIKEKLEKANEKHLSLNPSISSM